TNVYRLPDARRPDQDIPGEQPVELRGDLSERDACDRHVDLVAAAQHAGGSARLVAEALAVARVCLVAVDGGASPGGHTILHQPAWHVCTAAAPFARDEHPGRRPSLTRKENEA